MVRRTIYQTTNSCPTMYLVILGWIATAVEQFSVQPLYNTQVSLYLPWVFARHGRHQHYISRIDFWHSVRTWDIKVNCFKDLCYLWWFQYCLLMDNHVRAILG